MGRKSIAELPPPPLQHFAGTHLYTGEETGTVMASSRVKLTRWDQLRAEAHFTFLLFFLNFFAEQEHFYIYDILHRLYPIEYESS